MKGQTEAELTRLVEELGGGWGWDQGVMPYIKLTLPEAVALEAKLPKEETFKSPTDELNFHLVRAEHHARQGHDLLYERSGPKRSLWFKLALGRAQSILISLYVQERRRTG